jgi:CheY-like chemotaxis protein/two-component sensor histidine kinase
MAERFVSLPGADGTSAEDWTELAGLLDAARILNRQLDSGLHRIRMVRFGTIETRLSRAVNHPCVDENKKATLSIENGDLEIDTIVIDALIEPLIHLLKNAVVHGIELPETRRLIGKPETGKISVNVDGDQEALVLTVRDDGGGISISRLKERAVANGLIAGPESGAMSDRDALKLIFEQGLTTADKIDLNAGRGVGMAIVKECVESRGGSVLVDSQAQNGTTFTVLLPLYSRSSQNELKDEVSPPEILEPLILIVDDSSTVRNQAVKIVENAGFRTITANNGAEALELLLSGKWEPDLILSDVEMPQIDGWQLLEYIKTDENFGSIPVVMITSLDLPIHRKRASDLGASGYIVKPVNSFDLERVCRQHAVRV